MVTVNKNIKDQLATNVLLNFNFAKYFIYITSILNHVHGNFDKFLFEIVLNCLNDKVFKKKLNFQLKEKFANKGPKIISENIKLST